MEEIIAKVPRELIKQELTEDRKLRRTNKSGNDVYVVTWQDSPNTLREIGRLREIAFRAAGGGSGKSMDLDEFDTCDNPYKQLIVWDPEEEEYLADTDISWDETGRWMIAGNRYWLPAICSVFLRSS